MSETKYTNPYFVAAFSVVAVLGFVFGPAGQAIAAKFASGNGDSRTITDEQLSLIVNFIGAGTFILIIVHHFLEVGRKKVHSTM
ncbi:hypothetical protein BDR26DRAFT_1005806 [Obelidium mucronatum]|nr:hypothetical protein BDR26DRAFT_1005806 [Obelidium mucronatum]